MTSLISIERNISPVITCNVTLYFVYLKPSKYVYSAIKIAIKRCGLKSNVIAGIYNIELNANAL